MNDDTSVAHSDKLRPTSAEALDLVNSLRGEGAKHGNSDHWIDHAICVGECAGKLAAAAGLDVDHAKALGYIHDIGKPLGPSSEHPLNGYHYLKDRGYDDEYCSICLTHSFFNQECEMISGYRPADDFLRTYVENHKKTIYEDIVTLCDLYCTRQVLPLENRLIDVIIRYGSSERTSHNLEKIYHLKAEIEQRLGCTVESILGL